MSQDTDELLERVRQNDRAAQDRLLQRYRGRLRALIALRLDARLRARIDPSDVVQDSLAEANRRLAEYARTQPLPFYPWLRGLALEQLAQHYRRHVRAQKRSVQREEKSLSGLPDDSLDELADRLAASGSSPSARLRKQDLRRWLQQALARLPQRDREVIVLRHLEQLSVRDMAAVLGITEATAKVRHARALERLRKLLEHPDPETGP